jgi:hypothetical protein
MTRLHGTRMHRWEYNIKMVLGTLCECELNSAFMGIMIQNAVLYKSIEFIFQMGK